ncbi:MAG: cysteine desulfurase family protein [Hyphomicrobium sp.]|uniref:cysteine desulfurase family protein n=1 Tax=Hyphomicrobium sp. TaxID=82 RepID=UPI003562C791
MLKRIYLDNHATTPIDPRVMSKMLPFFDVSYGNPSSIHLFGIEALNAIDKARAVISKVIGSEKDEIVFTSGATEANNFAIRGIIEGLKRKHGNQPLHIISSVTEHKCVLNAIKRIQAEGVEITFLPVDSCGAINLQLLKKEIKPNTVLVSLMFANNEIGTINDIMEIGSICRSKNIIFHTDIAQALGKIHINLKNLPIDLASFSAHKLYGPKGVGFLYIKQELKKTMTPLLDGGGQEYNLRSGTLNVPGIVGMSECVRLGAENFKEDIRKYLKLRYVLYSRLSSQLNNIVLNGPDITPGEEFFLEHADVEQLSKTLKRLPNNLNITFSGIDLSRLLPRISHIAVSTGSACSSNSVQPSYVLCAIGLSDQDAGSSIRFGIGRFNTEEEMIAVADSIVEAVHLLRKNV